MSNTNSLTQLELLALGQKLRDAPAIEYKPWDENRPLARLEVVAFLKGDITAMRDKGYRVVQIAELLAENGFKISDAGLYDAMRKLNSSLTRRKISIAQMLSAHLAGPVAPPSATAANLSKPALRKSTNRDGPKASAHAPTRTEAQLGPDMVKVPSKVARLLAKLKPADAVVFKEALKQLRPGKQLITLDAQTEDTCKELSRHGLLRPARQYGEHAYEVPFEIAHIGNPGRQPTGHHDN